MHQTHVEIRFVIWGPGPGMPMDARGPRAPRLMTEVRELCLWGPGARARGLGGPWRPGARWGPSPGPLRGVSRGDAGICGVSGP